MNIAKFHHFDLSMLNPSLDSPLMDLVIDLDHLRRKKLYGSTHPRVFFQLKHIFHSLESIGSARIEGNNTTIAEYIEVKLGDSSNQSSSIREIQNIEKAMNFVEANVKDHSINRMFLSELHKMIVDQLPPPPHGEGDHTPGIYREVELRIEKSEHLPPDAVTVSSYMDELFDFINQNHPPKYDLLKAAIAHHRFVWIHPFGNGNGRTVRLFTYAMLVKLGFNVEIGRLLNPTAVFCSNRDEYYKNLALADLGTIEGLEKWCLYVLQGLKEEIEKIDHLLDYEFLRIEILSPTIQYALDRQLITDIEAKILRKAISKQVIQASDLKEIFSGKHSAEISRQIGRLIDKNMLSPISKGARKYVISFDNSILLRGVISSLQEKGFITFPDKSALPRK